jgi:hypothetical protein
MDTGQILAGRDQYARHAPASTIKTLLAWSYRCRWTRRSPPTM